MRKSEDNLIAWIANRYPAGDLPIGIGDDMAMLPACPDGFLLAADMLMDGVDFDTRIHSPEQIGRKALAVNLSDCAAMAVRPRWALVSVALPNAWSMNQAQGLLIGMEALANRYECRIVGGDTNSWNQPLVINVTIAAEPWKGVKPVRRAGAKIGDIIIVSGELGGSLAGHHLDFEPRIREARWLATHLGPSLHAMMDLSDGLSVDARRMAEASGMGIELDEYMLVEAVPSRAAQAASKQDGRSLLDHVVNDGEDFELLLAVDAGAWTTLGETPDGAFLSDSKFIPRYRMIGEAHAGQGLFLKTTTGRREPIEPRGWRHFTDK